MDLPKALFSARLLYELYKKYQQTRGLIIRNTPHRMRVFWHGIAGHLWMCMAPRLKLPIYGSVAENNSVALSETEVNHRNYCSMKVFFYHKQFSFLKIAVTSTGMATNVFKTRAMNMIIKKGTHL